MNIRPDSERVCVVSTVYAFLLYLLYHSTEEIEDTFFVFDSFFPDDITKKIVNGYHLQKSPSSTWYKELWYYKKEIRRHLPKLSENTIIFAQDHTTFEVIYLSNHQYTFIEDSQQICKIFYDTPDGKNHVASRKTLKCKIASLLLGPLYRRGMADNPQAVRLLLTKEDDSDFLANKIRLYVPNIDHHLWNSFSEGKRQLFIKVFDMDKDLLGMGNDDRILFLTDPLAESKSVSVEEQIRIFKEIISYYDESKVVIKLHPRDRFFDYRKLFPKSLVLDRAFPSELFGLLDVPFNRVVTTISSAVNPFIGKIPVDWYGVMNANLADEIGEVPAPAGVNVIKRKE